MRNKKTVQVICFRRWTRKNYAAFNSLGRQIKIGVLAASLSLVTLSPQQVSAQATTTQMFEREGESESVPIDEVLVAAEKTLAVAEPARVVSTINRHEIARLPVQDVQQLLSYISSIDLRQRGAGGVQADVSIRGGTYDQALILLNGINFTDPQVGHYNLDLPIDLQSIDRIEILQGAGSHIVGPNAFAGAINIVTGNAQKSKLQLRLSGGEHGYFTPSANATFQKSKWRFFGSASLKKSDGYTDNTDYQIADYFAQARYLNDATGNFNLQLGYQDKAYGANGFYSLTYPNQYEATRTAIASLDYRKRFKNLQVSSAAYFRRHYDRFELFRDNPAPWYTGHNYHRTDVLGANAQLAYRSFLGTTTVGVDLRSEHIYSNVLGEIMGKPLHVQGYADSIFYTKEKQRNIVSWIAEHSYTYQKILLAGGVQGSTSNDFGSYFCLSGDISYLLTPSIRVSGTANQSLRLPTFTDLYYQGATNVGNPNLNPERANNYEVSIKYLQSDVRAQASIFYRQGKNIIDWVRNSDAEPWQSQNHIALNTLGTDFEVSYTPQNSLQKVVQNVKFGYAYLTMNKENNGMQSSRALDYMAHKFSLYAIHALPLHFGFSWNATYQLRAGKYTDFASRAESNYDPVLLVDAKIFWKYRYAMLYLECSNMLNTKYFDYANLVQPGRWAKAGVQITIQ